MARAEIDASAADLDLRMTEGDLIAFNFLVKDAASWGASTFASHVKATPVVGAPILASLAVVVTVEGLNLDVKLNSAPVAALLASTGKYYWDMQEVGGLTRFSGAFYVMPQVTNA